MISYVEFKKMNKQRGKKRERERERERERDKPINRLLTIENTLLVTRAEVGG